MFKSWRERECVCVCERGECVSRKESVWGSRDDVSGRERDTVSIS